MTETDSTVSVRIVEDWSRIAPEEKRPARLDCRRFQFPNDASQNVRIASRNFNRAQMTIKAGPDNAQFCYLSDLALPYPQILDSAFILASGDSLIVESGAEVFAFGAAGDTVFVAEESFDTTAE